MYPSSLRMRAISTLSFEFGISARSCSALLALRMRVSMSATGSVSIVLFLLPGALGHARDDALVGELAQADTAEPELLEDGARPSAAVAARVVAHLVLRRPGGLHDQRLLRHYLFPPSAANGIPSAPKSARAWSSSVAVVVIATSRPRIWLMLS